MLILGVVLNEVISNIVDGILRLLLFKSEFCKCLKDKRHHGLVKVGSNG